VTPEPHPLSCRFAWRPAAGPLRRITPAQARAFDADGFFRLENALDPPDGARMVQAGPDGGPTPGPAADDRQRQYPILAGGAPAPPPLPGGAAA
jgi:hypothetical protein